MSKGLGACYLTPAMIQYHHDDILNRMYCNAEGSKKISMPRYYKEKIYDKEQRERVGKHTRDEMEKREDEYAKHYPGDYVRDKVESHKAAFKNFKINSNKEHDKL